MATTRRAGRAHRATGRLGRIVAVTVGLVALVGPWSASQALAAGAAQPAAAPGIGPRSRIVSTPVASKPPARTPTKVGVSRPPGGGLYVSGGHLMLNGQPFFDVGVDAYELGTDWGTNAGCGGELTNNQLNSFFASLPADTLVRFWASEAGLAVDDTTGQINWGPLDRVFNAAAAHHDLLIVGLADQWGACDMPPFKSLAWYQGGYKAPEGRNAAGRVIPLTYPNYVRAIVEQFKNSPALGMWEPVNEPEADTCAGPYTLANCNGHQTCPDQGVAAQALRSFFDAIGGEIHAADPGSLVESGFLAGGQCGTTWTDYAQVGASPGIDVLTYHDYWPATATEGGDQWNGIGERLAQAAALHKPIIAGEVGIQAGGAAGCPVTVAGRVADLSAKIRRQAAAGADAFLFWNWTPLFGSASPAQSSCGYDINPGDPTLKLLGHAVPKA